MAPLALSRKRTKAPAPALAPAASTSSRSASQHKVKQEEAVPPVMCRKCGSDDFDEVLLLCDKCDSGYHTFCLRPILPSVPKGHWFCPSCSSNKKPKQFPLIQTKIVDFFRIQRAGGDEPYKKKPKRRSSSSICSAKKRRRLLPFNPSDDPERRLAQMASLATALTAAGAEFSNDLVYTPGMAPRTANRAALEKGGMQVLHREDAQALELCRRMVGRGECPPLMVVFDPEQGFTVEADRSIRDLTIVTEYTGEVDYLRNREHDDGDSMMTLLSASDPARSLVICPDRRSNIARFISGINNHTPEGKKKQNLKCVRFDVGGECHVLLIAIRDICKGERLYYDYNGLEHEYPTEHFV